MAYPTTHNPHLPTHLLPNVTTIPIIRLSPSLFCSLPWKSLGSRAYEIAFLRLGHAVVLVATLHEYYITVIIQLCKGYYNLNITLCF